MIKLIAVGNTIMRDDGIAIKVTEHLKNQLEKRKIKVIFGETDVEYCINNLETNDFVIVVDATNFGIKPGKVTLHTFDDLRTDYKQGYSQHELSILEAQKIYRQHVKGSLIGIEVAKIEFGMELSEVLKKQFTTICSEVLKKIDLILEGV